MPEPVDVSREELGIVGSSPQIQQILETVRQVAATDITVLLIGESGVGKEVFAQAIHRLSRRSSNRIIAINCGAIPETLLESELFGHEKGAFTGAVESRKGLFEAASGGTIFLDEIGEMSLATQVRLLRVLEAFEFTRVGSTETRKANVRVIAATNRDLERDVQRGTFRQDLYYRLRSICIRIPPLREREEDIPLLIEHFNVIFSRALGTPPRTFTPEAIYILMEYHWPGNVRELKNFVERVITLERGEVITEEMALRHLDLPRRPHVADNPGAIVHLPGMTPEQAERELIYRALIDLRNEVGSLKEMVQRIAGPPPVEHVQRPALPAPQVDPIELLVRKEDIRLEDIERRLILAALKRFDGNRRHAANALGVSERTLYRKLSEYKVDEGEDDGRPLTDDR